MTIDVVIPKIGMSMQDGTIALWRKQVGDLVEKGEPLFELETEKVSVDVEAPDEGVLVEILVAAGETADVGAVVARIEVE
ncbi:MAG: acyltransferase [Chloroflexales bacterium]|nr:acyltransferase [Chloroflexales bacterium]